MRKLTLDQVNTMLDRQSPSEAERMRYALKGDAVLPELDKARRHPDEYQLTAEGIETLSNWFLGYYVMGAEKYELRLPAKGKAMKQNRPPAAPRNEAAFVAGTAPTGGQLVRKASGKDIPTLDELQIAKAKQREENEVAAAKKRSVLSVFGRKEPKHTTMKPMQRIPVRMG